MEEYVMHVRHYRYLQVQHALLPYSTELNELAESSPLESRLLLGPMGRGGTSQIYKSLILNAPECFSALWSKWERVIGPLEEEDWRDACMAPKEMAISSRLRLIQLKILHMAYLAPACLYQAYTSCSPPCP